MYTSEQWPGIETAAAVRARTFIGEAVARERIERCHECEPQVEAWQYMHAQVIGPCERDRKMLLAEERVSCAITGEIQSRLSH